MPTPDLPTRTVLSGRVPLNDGFVTFGLISHPYIQSWGVIRDGGSTIEHFITLQNGSSVSGGMLVFTSRRFITGSSLSRERLPIRKTELFRVHHLGDSMLRQVAYFHAFDPSFLDHIRSVSGWETFTPKMTGLRAPTNYESVIAERTRIAT